MAKIALGINWLNPYLMFMNRIVVFFGIFFFCLLAPGLKAQEAKTAVRLISSVDTFEAGRPFVIGVHLQMPVGWHTYWINPGDSGIPTAVQWTLPEGFTATALEWPVPKRIETPPLVTFGYEEEVLLLTTITPPKNFKVGEKAKFSAVIRWLECKETCVPGKVTAELSLLAGNHERASKNETISALFQKFQAEVPRKTVEVQVFVFPDKTVELLLAEKGVQSIQFFPLTEGKLSLAKPFTVEINAEGATLYGQFEELSSDLSGVLVVEKAEGGELLTFQSQVVAGIPQNRDSPEKRSLGLILLFAFLGGLILNLMPCVLPVLSLKILGFVNEAQKEGSQVWKQGVAFTAGVLISFWVLTGVLVTLRLGGEGLGWGFQLQSPSFVLGMTLFFLAMTLNLFGVFEFGSSLGSLQNQVTEKKGLGKSFASGILATVVATPCSAPFMGAAVGYALSQSMGLTFLVMTFLGFGVAAPYLLLSLKPEWIRQIPKPGEWMIGFRQFLGFLMLGTVLWLVWVYAQLQGIVGLGSILIAIGFISFGLWLWGIARGRISKAFAVLLIGVTIWLSIPRADKVGVEKFSAVRVEELHRAGKPLLIDFTAAWCLTCQVNKKLVLHREEIQAAFREKGVVVMEADWTNSDPEITKALEKFGRASVPLYVLYGRDPKAAPVLLPEILTKEIVLRALDRL